MKIKIHTGEGARRWGGGAVAMTPQERLEHLCDLACEAWESTTGHVVNAERGERYEYECLVAFRSAVRERLAQGVQAWALDIEADRAEIEAKAWADAQRDAEEERYGPERDDGHHPGRPL